MTDTASSGLPAEQRLRQLQDAIATRPQAELFRVVIDLAERVKERGGRLLLIGGCVRDDLLELPVHDFDVEVFGIDADILPELVAKYGPANSIGSAFGILKLHRPTGDIDIALPRQDAKIGAGHRGFAVHTNPDLPPAEAARRRDFTINAIAQDPLSGEYLDSFGGRDDLTKRLLRVVDAATFGDDPLRVLRGLQFVARFNLTVDSDTEQVMRNMIPRLRELAPDRFRPEWEKLLFASKPSLGLSLAMKLGYFSVWHPPFALLDETPHDPIHHPEGNVWEHTLLTVDQARRVIDMQTSLTDLDRRVIMLAALTHDLGKGTTTGLVNNRYRSHGHEEAGVEPAVVFVRSIGFSQDTAEIVGRLVAEHLKPTVLAVAATQGTDLAPGTFRRLIRRLHPATLPQLLALAEADYLARGPFPQSDGSAEWPKSYPYRAWWETYSTEHHAAKQLEPIVSGRDLIDLGWKPNPQFGQLLRAAEILAEHGWNREKIMGVLRTASSFDDGLKNLERRASDEEQREISA